MEFITPLNTRESRPEQHFAGGNVGTDRLPYIHQSPETPVRLSAVRSYSSLASDRTTPREPFAMAVTDKALIDKLNPTCTKALNQAVAMSFSRTHFSVEIEHWLLKLLEGTNNDLTFILRQYSIDSGRVRRELEKPLNQFKT